MNGSQVSKVRPIYPARTVGTPSLALKELFRAHTYTPLFRKTHSGATYPLKELRAHTYTPLEKVRPIHTLQCDVPESSGRLARGSSDSSQHRNQSWDGASLARRYPVLLVCAR